jgi:hypothetical protein
MQCTPSTNGACFSYSCVTTPVQFPLKTEAPSTRVEGKFLPVRHCSRNNVRKKNIVQELVYSDRAAVELQDCKLTYSEAHQLVDETPPVDAALMPHGVENNL